MAGRARCAVESRQGRVGRAAAAVEDGDDAPLAEVEALETLDVRANQEIAVAQRIHGLIEEEAHQPIGDDERVIDVDAVGRMLGRIGDEDDLGALLACDPDGNVGGESAVDEEPSIDPLGREDQGNGGARPDGLGQVARRQDHDLPVGQIGGDGAEGDEQGIEVPPGDQIPLEHRRVHQSVDLRLEDRCALEVEATLPLLPHDQRPQDAERAGRLGLVGPEELAQRQLPGERVQLPTAVATGIQRTQDGAHAGADDQIGPQAETVQRAEDTDVGETLGAASGEDQGGPSRMALLCLHRRGG